MRTKVCGKSGITATVICDSITESGNRLTTFEIEYWRGILAELNTHRMLSKNSASSRAIPFEKMQQQLTGRPVRFGAANKGMQDNGKHDAFVEGRLVDVGAYGAVKEALHPEEAWEKAKQDAIFWSKAFYKAGYAKQVYNRGLETYQMMKTVISGTEWDNLFWLRNHGAADPSFEELARCMQRARDESTPQLLKAGEYHLPYVDSYWEQVFYRDGTHNLQVFYIGDILSSSKQIEILYLEDAIKVSCARCCAVSFRNTDYGLEQSKRVYERLISDSKIHGSALEHCATPMQPKTTVKWGEKEHAVNIPQKPSTWEPGISHMDKEQNLWSGNFKGFVQYRKLIPNENYVKP